jgi:hypothetical protein
MSVVIGRPAADIQLIFATRDVFHQQLASDTDELKYFCVSRENMAAEEISGINQKTGIPLGDNREDDDILRKMSVQMMKGDFFDLSYPLIGPSFWKLMNIAICNVETCSIQSADSSLQSSHHLESGNGIPAHHIRMARDLTRRMLAVYVLGFLLVLCTICVSVSSSVCSSHTVYEDGSYAVISLGALCNIDFFSVAYFVRDLMYQVSGAVVGAIAYASSYWSVLMRAVITLKK